MNDISNISRAAKAMSGNGAQQQPHKQAATFKTTHGLAGIDLNAASVVIIDDDKQRPPPCEKKQQLQAVISSELDAGGFEEVISPTYLIPHKDVL